MIFDLAFQRGEIWPRIPQFIEQGQMLNSSKALFDRIPKMRPWGVD